MMSLDRDHDGLYSQLLGLGVDAKSVTDVCQITATLSEALELLGRQPDGQVSEAAIHWREYFSSRSQSLYYSNERIGANTWDAPLCFQFREWQLDASLYGVELPLAAALYLALDRLLAGLGHPPEKAYQALGMLCKLVGNVSDCSNSEERYRQVRISNPKFRQCIWEVAGAPDLLALVGFRRQGDCLVLPPNAALGPLRAAAARMRRLADRRGHSGSAVVVEEDGAGDGRSRPPSDFYGTPGFRYQEQIWHCSMCRQPINDGSEWLWTGHHEAPRGEYRYRCSTCEGSGTMFDLCQTCWDAFQEQQQQGRGQQGQQGQRLLHPAAHAFQHVGPRMTRHNDYYGNHGGGGGSSSWGRGPGGGGYSRGLHRLSERYGMSFA